MAQFVGVDYGTRMIRAAAVDSAQQEPSLINLAGHEPYVPVAVEVESGTAIGWDACKLRRQTQGAVAVDFRDHLLAPESTITVGGGNYDGVDVQTQLFTHLNATMRSAAPDAKGVTVAIPDSWPAAKWSLPVALYRSGWVPLCYVREWAAALASRAAPESTEVLFLSLGFGSAQATLCTMREDRWCAVATATVDRLSGRAIRQGLTDELSEDVIHQTRRDPRQYFDASGELDTAIDELMRQLCHSPSATFNAELFGENVARPIDGQDLTAFVPAAPDQLCGTVEKLLSNASPSLNTCPIVAWGELAVMLPINEWLAPFTPSRQPIVVAPLEAVAFGAARLGALATETDLLADRSALPAVRLADGTYLHSAGGHPAGGEGGVTPVLERVPANVLGGATQYRRAFLVRLDDQGNALPSADARVEVPTVHFRLGRNPLSNYVFDSHRDPYVSAAHAVITRDGADYTITDLDSANGTYVNGERLVKPQRFLRHGDEIRLGRHGARLRFEHL